MSAPAYADVVYAKEERYAPFDYGNVGDQRNYDTSRSGAFYIFPFVSALALRQGNSSDSVLIFRPIIRDVICAPVPHGQVLSSTAPPPTSYAPQVSLYFLRTY